MAIGPAYGDGYVGVDNSTFTHTAYIKGNEFVDGSVRLTLDAATEKITRVECRVAGVWILSELLANLAPDSVADWIVDDILGEFVLNDATGVPVQEG